MKELSGLVPKYLDHWNKFGENGLPYLIDCRLPSLVLMIEYKKIPPIESLPEDERLDLMKYADDMYPEGTEEQRLKAAKIVYTIGTLL